MTRDGDEDALTWGGDEDPTLAVSADERRNRSAAVAPRDQSPLPAEWKVVGAPGRIRSHGSSDPSEADEPAAGDAEDDGAPPSQTNSFALVVLSALGGVYLLYAIGWALTAGRVQQASADVVADVMFAVGAWLAVLAPAGWFALALGLRGLSTRARILWLLLGALALIPFPLLIGRGLAA
ncbi:hypothetical protein WDJ51_05250 [Rathayibacter sp. YIM 133350]|uniref:hypothetical protein n=1 Tax=Rathayibacter sp. YIM 133350 TaxID=3131992 RepID=UPI00307D7047